MMPTWDVSATKQSGPERILIAAWDEHHATRAATSLGYVVQSCKKIKVGWNEFKRRRNGQIAKAEKRRLDARNGAATAPTEVGSYQGSLKK